MSSISVDNYKYKTWYEVFPDKKVKLEELYIHSSWKHIFKKIQNDNQEKWNDINNALSECLAENLNIFPHPDLVFSAFNKTPFDKIKVVIIGQDPYHNERTSKNIPEAIGTSFSVPIGVDIPSSLKNIYKNALKYKQMLHYPSHGNLDFWAYQGCLMLNTSLTVIKNNPNVHASIWKWFTDKIIETISDKKSNVAFALWGAPAYSKNILIDSDKHFISASSHPSGLSCNNPMKNFPAFVNCDHFGSINKHLKSHSKKQILWQIT